MEEFPASKVHLQPDLLGSFPADICPDIAQPRPQGFSLKKWEKPWGRGWTLLASLGVAIAAKFRSSVVGRGVFGRKIGVTYRRNSPFQWWERGGGGKVYDK